MDLLADVLRELVARAGVDPGRIEDNITGCLTQAGEQTFNIGRNAWLAAGLPEDVPGTTIDRQCGSSQQAIHFAAQGVMAGAYDLVVASGVESMTRAPMFSSTMGKDPFGVQLVARYGRTLVPQGISADLIATRGVRRFCRELGIPSAWFEEHVNPSGGAIAIGHPLGATGAKLMTTLLHELERTGGRYGLQTMCEGGGMANAAIIERLG